MFDYFYLFNWDVIGSIFNEDVDAIIIPTNIDIKLPAQITPNLHEKQMTFYCKILNNFFCSFYQLIALFNLPPFAIVFWSLALKFKT